MWIVTFSVIRLVYLKLLPVAGIVMAVARTTFSTVNGKREFSQFLSSGGREKPLPSRHSCLVYSSALSASVKPGQGELPCLPSVVIVSTYIALSLQS